MALVGAVRSIRERLGVNVEIQDLFERFNTLERLFGHIQTTTCDHARAEPPELNQSGNRNQPSIADRSVSTVMHGDQRRHDSTPRTRIEVLEEQVAALTRQLLAVKSQPDASIQPPRRLDFSLYYFGDYQAEFSKDKYQLLFEGARFADEHGFDAVWIPERHFHSFGGFSPNPAVVAAALARATSRIAIRASVVVPIHHPIRLAEEWATVDNLAQGRVGLALASGWHPNDFVLDPGAWKDRKAVMLERAGQLRSLWRGETLRANGGRGEAVDVSIHPLPMQPELPIWLASMGSSETFIEAGRIGAGVLTNFIGQDMSELRTKIQSYRAALTCNGFDSSTGRVTVLAHTLVGADSREVREVARGPFCKYLESSVGLFQRMTASERDSVDFDSLSPKDRKYLIEQAYERYVQGRALVGDLDTCERMVSNLREAGVDEIACFIDFGVSAEQVLDSLNYLRKLKTRLETNNAKQSIAERNRLPIESDPKYHQISYQSIAPIVDPEATGVPPTAVVRSMRLPSSGDQRMLWLIGKMGEDGSIAYNNSTSLKLHGPLDLDQLQESIRCIVARHEALRTTFSADGDTQLIHADLVIGVELVDLSQQEPTLATAALQTFYDEECTKAFDFTRGLLRVSLLRLGQELHVLVLTIHHLICDGVSVGNVLQELEAYYSALRRGKAIILPPAMQFREFLEWREQYARSERFLAQQRYWLAKVNELPTLELPTDLPRPPLKTFNGARQTSRLDEHVCQGLRKFSERHQCTQFMSLYVAFCLLLHQMSGQDDVVSGVAFAGRTPTGSEAVVGYCANVYPIRSTISGNLTLRDYVSGLKRELLEAYGNQDYPFADLVIQAHKTRDTSRSPFFSVAFNWDRYRVPDMADLEVEFQPQPIRYAEYDLMPNVMEVNGELVMMWDYNTDLFSSHSIQGFSESFLRLLDSLVECDGDVPALGLSILSASDEHLLLNVWNDTFVPTTDERCVHQLLEQHADENPNKGAVVCGGHVWSYGELNQAANRVAHWLIAHGVQPDESVAVCLDPSPHAVAVLFGILKAGASYAALDPDHPRARQERAMKCSRASVLIVDAMTQESLSELAELTVVADSTLSAFSDKESNPEVAVSPQNLVYTVFTSGSTGQPKGVQVEHAGLSNLVAALRMEVGLHADDVVLSIAPFSFDLSVPDLYLTLCTGATLILAEKDARWQPHRLQELMAEHQVTFMEATPPTFQMLVDSGWQGDPERLRLITGGETVPIPLAAALFKASTAFWNAYGPTECTAWATIHRVTESDLGRTIIPIGRPLQNLTAYVLDSRLSQVPVGVTGELFLGGVGLARGYLGDPEVTAAKFVTVANGKLAGRRLYATGDMVKWLSEGELEFVGRRDYQVKLRGFRIELEDVEAQLRKAARLRNAAVTIQSDAAGNKQLLGFVQAFGKEQIDLPALREHLRHQLPDYMLPSSLHQIEHMPITLNGKVDRAALPRVDAALSRTAADVPKTELQRMLVSLWGQLLSVDVGVSDDFFSIGGSSLMLHQLQSRIESLTGVRLTIRELFRAPTVRTQETAILSHTHHATADGASFVGTVAIAQGVE